MYAGFEIEGAGMTAALEAAVRACQPTDDEMREVGTMLVQRIIRRTRRGNDYKGRPFKPYSDAYHALRDRKGRNTEPVSLTYNGKMLSSMTSEAKGGVARLYFSSAAAGKIANYHNSLEPRKKMPLRRFLAVESGTPEHRAALRLLERRVAKRIEREQ